LCKTNNQKTPPTRLHGFSRLPAYMVFPAPNGFYLIREEGYKNHIFSEGSKGRDVNIAIYFHSIL